MKTYQITLGKLWWDATREDFRPLDGWDMEGSRISLEKLAENEEMARRKSANIYGWEMKLIEETRCNP